MKRLKKAIAFGLIAVMPVFSGCAAKETALPEITMAQVVDANRREIFLEDGGSYQSEISYFDGYGERAYSDAELRSLTFFSEEGEYTEITVGDAACSMYEGEYEFYLVADEHWTEKQAPVFINCLDKASTEKETIEACVQEGESLMLSTAFSAEETKEYLERYGVAYVDGDIMKVVYTLDAQTYALGEMVSKVEKNDGTVEEFCDLKITYHPERPKLADEMYQFMTESKDRHTVTIILDPNTENEKSFSADLPAGSPVYEVLPEGYETLYLDKECTKVLEGAIDRNEDVVVYSVPAVS